MENDKRESDLTVTAEELTMLLEEAFEAGYNYPGAKASEGFTQFLKDRIAGPGTTLADISTIISLHQ